MSDTTQAYDPETGEVFDAAIEMPTMLPASVVSSEIDVMIATSKRFPRRKDRDIALKVMDRATLNAEIAAECIYNLKRGEKIIQGPSIRFAEIVRSCFGNIRVAARFVRIDADDKMRQAVIVEAVAYDTETNDMETAQVRRSIMTSPRQGTPRPFTADMIAVTVMAAQAIARRNAILALVPKAVWIDGFYKVEGVVKGEEKTLNERRTKMLEEFAKFGIKPEDLFASMGVESEQEIGLNDMPRLAGMWSALKDGEAPESVLGVVVSPGHATVKNPMANSSGMGPDDDPTRSERRAEVASREAREKSAGESGSGSTSSDAGGMTKGAGSVSTGSTQETTPATRGRGRPPGSKNKEKPEAEAKPASSPPTDPSDPGDLPESLRRTPDNSFPQGETETEEVRDRAAEQSQEQREAAAAKTSHNNAAAARRATFDRLMETIKTFDGSAGALMDWFRSTRAARNDLTLEESGEVNDFYKKRFNELDKDE